MADDSDLPALPPPAYPPPGPPGYVPPGYPPPGYPGSGYPAPYGLGPRTNSKAIASLVVSIGGAVFVFICGCFTPFAGVVSVVLAHVARREIREAQGAETGIGLAIAGEAIGWIEIALIGIAIVAIGFLILLGNQTKDVFSNISAGLGN